MLHYSVVLCDITDLDSGKGAPRKGGGHTSKSLAKTMFAKFDTPQQPGT